MLFVFNLFLTCIVSEQPRELVIKYKRINKYVLINSMSNTVYICEYIILKKKSRLFLM